MASSDQFFGALREVFAKNRAGDWTQTFIITGAAVSVTIAAALGFRRWRTRRQIVGRIDAVAKTAGLTPPDLAYLNHLAATAGLPVLEVMTSLAPFEHATAAALGSEPPGLRPTADSAFERVGRLRRALRFSPLSPHLWLLTTRELSEGDPVTVGGTAARAAEVNEASFAVDLPATVASVLGASVTLTIDRADDARYLVRTRLLAIEAPPGTEPDLAVRRVFFAHDEQPERQQHRAYVRVRVQGEVTVRSADLAVVPPAAHTEAALSDSTKAGAAAVAGTLVDVSAGGLALDLPVAPSGPIRRGARVHCSFSLGEGETFNDLAALVVAATAGSGADVQHLRLSFTALPEPARNRLVVAVANHQRGRSADGRV